MKNNPNQGIQESVIDLSDEHIKQVCRFAKVPYEEVLEKERAAQNLRGWIEYKRYNYYGMEKARVKKLEQDFKDTTQCLKDTHRELKKAQRKIARLSIEAEGLRIEARIARKALKTKVSALE